MALVETHLSEAERRIRRERRRSTDERQALRTFRSAVADVRPTAANPSGGPTAAGTLTRGGPSPSLETVRREYERTVMAVPHYEAEYGDTYAESVAAEFGDDVAAGLTGSGTLTPNLHRTLVAGSTAAMRERSKFISLLDAEADSLGAVRSTVASTTERLRTLDDTPLSERTPADLASLRESVVAVGDRLDETAADRQATLTAHRRDLSSLVSDVTTYLYGPLPVDYPALDALATTRSLVETALRRVDRRTIASL